MNELAPVLTATVVQAGVSTALSGASGLLIGLVFGEWGRRWTEGKRLFFIQLFSIPFLLPTLVVIQIFLMAFGNQSLWVNWGILPWGVAYGWSAVIALHVLMNVCWVAVMVAQSYWEIPRSTRELLSTLGVNRFDRWRTLEWPYVRAAFGVTLGQVYCLCVTSFTVVTLVGGGPPVETLETVIYSSVRSGALDQQLAWTAAIAQVMLTLPVQWLLMRQGNGRLPALPGERFSISTMQKGYRGVNAWLGSLLLLGVATFGAILGSQFELWSELAFSALFSTAVVLGVLVSLLSVLKIGSRFQARGWNRSAMTWWNGFLISSGGSTLVIALVVGLVFEPVLRGRWSWIGALFVQVLLFLPFGLRATLPLLKTTDTHAIELARVWGKSRFSAWWLVEGARWRRVIVHVSKMVFVFSIGEFAAVSYFSDGSWRTLSMVQAHWIGKYRFEDSQMIAAFFVLVTFSLMLGGRKWSH